VKNDTIKAIFAVLLGSAIIVMGCMTQLVGHSSLHGFLVAFGAVMVFCGGLELI